jgi:aspartate aminotransferase-like enzyme
MSARLQFQLAEERHFDAIHALNYSTFVEEIPQHPSNDQHRLVDRFHEENTYLIALAGEQLVGMLAMRTQRPFSLDAKLPGLDTFLPAGRNWAEVRLLAVKSTWRGSTVFPGLLRLLEQEFLIRDLDAVVVSATTRQLKLYRHLGFRPFGPLVGQPGALYQPMLLELENFQLATQANLKRPVVNLLPGPVSITETVMKAFQDAPASHRGARVLEQIRHCRAALCSLTGARHAALIPGGGTMANEVVCAQISQLPGHGLVVSHGEFGERLADHAKRMQLLHHHWQQAWSEPIDFPGLEKWLDAHPETQWLWTVHCETSTGAITDPSAWRTLCEPRNIKICLDCVSSLGALPLNLTGITLASGSSGKGLASLAGIGIVFYQDNILATHPLPRALDLALYATADGVPFTINSNLVAALHATLTHTDWVRKINQVSITGSELRDALAAKGFTLAAADATSVITIMLPKSVDALQIANKLERLGWLVAARSRHLQERGWLQICLLGDLHELDVSGLPETLHRLGCVI